MKRALCIGHLSYDITLPLDGHPKENTKYQIDRTLESSGGPAANAASLLAQWGIETAFIGIVGCDSYGERALFDLQRAGVDTRGVFRKEQCSSPLSIILVNIQTGSRTIINRRGGCMISSDETRNILTRLERTPPDLLLFDGHEPEASFATLEHFPGAISILDAGSLRRGTEILSYRVDYCIASERFAREIAGTFQASFSSPILPSSLSYGSLLAALKQKGIRNPVITLGETGCCFLEPEISLPNAVQLSTMYQFPSKPSGYLLPAYPAKVVDTTGAGDIFHGSFAAALLGEKSFREALLVATVAAGLSVERLGGKSSIPALEEVMRAQEHWVPEWHPILIDHWKSSGGTDE